jgi:hypothetical protein
MVGQEDNPRIQESWVGLGSYRGKPSYSGEGGAEGILVVPVHGNKPIKVGLLKGLIKDAGLTNEEFLRLCYERRRR